MHLERGQFVIVDTEAGPVIGIVDEIDTANADYGVHKIDPKTGETLTKNSRELKRYVTDMVFVPFASKAIRPATLAEIPAVRRCKPERAVELGIEISAEEAAALNLKATDLPSGRKKYLPIKK